VTVFDEDRESESEAFFCVVVVVDDVVDDLDEFLSDLDVDVVVVVALVDVDAGGATGGAMTVVVGVAATVAAGSIKVPAAPGRGTEPAGDDVAPAGGRAGAASVGGDGGGAAVSGAVVTGSATSSGAAGTDRAAWRARRTSG